MIPRDGTEVVERVVSLLPQDDDFDQHIIEASTLLEAAITRMSQSHEEYLLVHDNRHLVGVLCYRSIAQVLIELPPKERKDFSSLTVDMFAEDVASRRVHHTETIDSIVQRLERNGYLIIGHHWPLGIITCGMVMRHFHKHSSAYIFIREIELAVRYLISVSISQEELVAVASRCLREKYLSPGDPPDEGKVRRRPLPTSLDQFDFSDYVTLIGSKDDWSRFQAAFGGIRTFVSTRLDSLRDIRNTVFHFKDTLSPDVLADLQGKRNWLVQRVNLLDSKAQEAEK